MRARDRIIFGCRRETVAAQKIQFQKFESTGAAENVERVIEGPRQNGCYRQRIGQDIDSDNDSS